MRKRTYWIATGAIALGVVLLQACSGDNNDTDAGTDASNDTTQPDVNKPDVKNDVVTSDVANDVVTSDAGDGGCPATWMEVPDAGNNALTPEGGLPALILHASASGTQDYTCEATSTDAGTTYAWVFVGPEAELDDCMATLIGHHFASDGGAAAPEWQTLDDSYVIGHKVAAYTDDAGSVPWLLLGKSSSGGTGTISNTAWVQRLFTNGGIAPTTTCDQTNVNTTTKVPYTAQYYFYGP